MAPRLQANFFTANNHTYMNEGTPDDEAETIAERVKDLVKLGMDLSDMAVLFR